MVKHQADQHKEVPLINASNRGSISAGSPAYFPFRDLSDRGPICTATSLLRKDLKLREYIGDPNANPKDQLIFVSVKHQIYETQRHGYTKQDIFSSIIRSVHSSLRLKSILEMRSNLTLAILMGYLQHHYEEKGSTDL